MLWYHDPGSTPGLLRGRDTQQEMRRMGQNIKYICACNMGMVPNNYIKKQQRNTTKNDRKNNKQQ